MDQDEGTGRARHRGRGEAPLPGKSAGQPDKIKTLLEQGEELFRTGRNQRAVHVWTRILFIDRGNRPARDAIDRAKRAIAEQERQVDAQVVEAVQCLEAGDRWSARRIVEEALARDRRHPEARGLLERIEALERRTAPSPGPQVYSARREAAPPPPERRRSAARRNPRPAPGRPVSPLRVATFLFCALCVFAAGAIWLHLNWDFLASEGILSASRGARPVSIEEVDVPPLPFPGELHYYNGSRLYAKGRYREALAELKRVERRSPAFESARSLILRIEERLLRGAASDASTPLPMATR